MGQGREHIGVIDTNTLSESAPILVPESAGYSKRLERVVWLVSLMKNEISGMTEPNAASQVNFQRLRRTPRT